MGHRQSSSIRALQWYLKWTDSDLDKCLEWLSSAHPESAEEDRCNMLLQLDREAQKMTTPMAAVTAVVLANRVESLKEAVV